jgi:TonB-dependent starch-binding outer membrane protein SusC
VRVTDPTTGVSRYYEVGTGAQGVRNPVALAEQIIDQAPENRLLGNFTGSVQLAPWATTSTTLGVDYANSVRQTYIPRSNPIGAEFSGVARQAERSLQNLNFQQLLTLTPRIASNQELEVVGGYEYSRFDNRGFEAIMQGFITDAFSWNNLGAGTQAGSPVPVSYDQESKLVSFFSRANYGLAGKYFLTGVVRYDGSSRLAEGNKWSTFPAVSASWRINEEEFMASKPFGLSTLALRAGWGRQGNQAVRPYGTQLLLRADNGARYPFGSTITTGLSASQVANPDLKWETAEQVNVGVDYGFANDRFTGLVDFYQKKTKDLLLEVTVPQPAVVSTRLENIGSIRNTGVEATLDGQLWQSGNRSLTSGLVLSVERNEVVEIGGDREFIITASVNGQGQSGRNAQRIIPGQPLGTFWGPRFVRVENGKQLFACERSAADCVNGVTTTPAAADEGIIGDANPAFTAGFRSNMNWGRLDASWLWRGEFGRDVFNNTALVYSTKGNAKQGRNFLSSALNDQVGIDEPSIYSSRWIEDGSFVRLQNVTVGYTFALPARVLAGRTARVYVSGDNLILMSDYTGYDPEVYTDRGVATRGMDYLNYPRARTFTLGARVQF